MVRSILAAARPAGQAFGWRRSHSRIRCHWRSEIVRSTRKHRIPARIPPTIPGATSPRAIDPTANRTPMNAPAIAHCLGFSGSGGRAWMRSGAGGSPRAYSHSIVPGGLLVMSSTTRLTSRISLIMREAICSSRS
jgi:hypothetical protein